jgi:hypothetical protein
MDDYEKACKEAATRQGLDAVTERLTAEGIAHYVAQTGGFCMAVHVPIAGSEERKVGITVDGPDGEWLVCLIIDTLTNYEELTHLYAAPDMAIVTVREHIENKGLFGDEAAQSKAADYLFGRLTDES